jgi:malate permease and related proteins
LDLFIDILNRVTLPIIVLVVIGWAVQGKLKLDVGTLNRVQVYVIMPAFLVHFLATGKQPLSAIWPVFYVGVVLFLFQIPIGWLTTIIFRQRASLGPMMGLGTGYANVGFFGIPVAQLAFGPDYLIYMSVMTALMTILICTVGVALLAPAGGSKLGKLKTAFETPLIPSVMLGLALRGFNVEIPTLIAQPMQFLGSIFTPLALFTLGAQIAAAKIVTFEWVPQILILILKFLIAPLLAWGICSYMEFPRDITNVIVVAAATPVGVLVTIFAAEYKTEPEFISTAVVVSTALSPIFVTLWILATRIY